SGRRRDARPHHPHQELAADRAGARRAPARRLEERCDGRGRSLRRALSRLFPPQQLDVGATAKDAAIAADIAENTVEVITDAEAIGEYRCISENDMFEVEYWSLEQAKLGKGKENTLARQVCVVTGGGSGIGAATARAMAAEGAEIAILDRDHDMAVKA